MCKASRVARGISLVVLLGGLFGCGANNSQEQEGARAANAGTAVETAAVVETEARADREEPRLERYENDDFSILYPANLHQAEAEEEGGLVAFESRAEEGSAQERLTISVKTYEEHAPYTNRLVGYHTEQMAELLNQFIVNKRDGYYAHTATASGVRALINYQEYDDGQTGETRVLYNLLVPLEKKLYLLTYSCSKEAYEAKKLHAIRKTTESIEFKSMPESAWNVRDLNLSTNGNQALAIAELSTYRSLSNGMKVKPADLFRDPRKYYGQAVTVTGTIVYLDQFEPIGGLRSEIVLETRDGTYVDVLGIRKPDKELKLGYRTTLTGLPIGKGDVPNEDGGVYTYVFLVSD
ncbi:hypothetical protein [Cohnella boryungensis]|uniref:Lipoprotein n=1 Tax=Cohnella boryungensis TaxID=768479 RepID=A0ABV8S672_9BACL